MPERLFGAGSSPRSLAACWPCLSAASHGRVRGPCLLIAAGNIQSTTEPTPSPICPAPCWPFMADQQSDDRARPYKSRSKRPCDFCRYKRAACLLAAAPPCELCSRYGRPCTFLENPAKRRRCNPDHDTDTDLAHTDAAISPVAASPDSSRPHTSPPELAPPLASDSAPDPSHEPPSLDAGSSHNAQIVGLSGEADPYLLRLYRFDTNDQCSFQQLSIRNVGLSDGVPVQFMVQDNSLASKAQPGDFGKSMSAIRAEVTGMVEDAVGKRLIRL